jgi:hypothetical protein
MRTSPRHVECCAVLGPKSQGETAFSPLDLLVGGDLESNSCLRANFVRIFGWGSVGNSSAGSIVGASVKAFYEMIVTGRQRIHLVKGTSSVAKGWTLLTMKFLEVQINLSRVLGISSEVMPGAWRFSAHDQDGAADLNREMVNVIRIPRRIFNVLGNGD